MNPTPRRILVAINPEASFARNRDIGPVVVAAMSNAGCDVTTLREPNAELLRLALRSALAEPTGVVSAGFGALVNDRANTWRRPRGKEQVHPRDAA